MPTTERVEDGILPGYVFGDMDIGEFFPNIPLHATLQQFSGLDLSRWNPCQGGSPYEVYARLCMGLRPCPYLAVQMLLWILEIIQDIHQHKDKDNLFRWDEVVVNLPGTIEYDVRYPRVYLWDKISKIICPILKAYIDDIRAGTASIELCRKVIRWVVSKLQYYGFQDAARKRTAPHCGEVPWAGTILDTTDGEVSRRVTQEHWDKSKELIKELQIMLDAGGE